MRTGMTKVKRAALDKAARFMMKTTAVCADCAMKRVVKNYAV